MEPKKWFLVKIINGRMEIVSQMYDSLEEARRHYTSDMKICETIYG